MTNLDNFEFVGNVKRGEEFCETLKSKNFLFSLVISYTETCEIPGITIAGADIDSMKFTPPADAEYLYYGYCKIIPSLPMTPDGKPTPALLTKTALESSSIPHIVLNAGSKMNPQLPFIHTGISYGKNILIESAMTNSEITKAIDYGRMVGRTLASLTDCLIIGESIPGGTTTALAVLRALGYNAKVSSSIPENPSELKNSIVNAALERLSSDSPYEIMAQVGDPMIPFVTGILSSASDITKVLLAGGTQMISVLAFSSKLGFNEKNTAIGTTSYIANDNCFNFKTLVTQVADVPAIVVNPNLENSQYPGLKAFSQGFAKEGVGAGGSIIASMIKTGINTETFLSLTEKEYGRIFTSL